MVHFLPILRPHTDPNLGDCSYLNTCHRMDTCRYMHWVLETPTGEPVAREENAVDEGADEVNHETSRDALSQPSPSSPLLPFRRYSRRST